MMRFGCSAILLALLGGGPSFGQDAAVKIADPTGPWVYGQLVDHGGRPLAGAVATLEPIETPYQAALRRLEGREPELVARATGRHDGHFSLRAPAAGLWRLRMSAPGRETQSLDLRPLVLDRELEPIRLPAMERIELEPSAAASEEESPGLELPILTIDTEGEPLAGVVVGLVGAAVPQLVTGDEGRGILRLPAKELPELELWGPGGEMARARIPSALPASDGEPMVLELGMPPLLTGRVVDLKRGTPVAGAWIVSRFEPSGLAARSDAKGRFALPVLEQRGELEAEAPGFLPFTRRFGVGEASRGELLIVPEIPLRAAVEAFGHVTDLDGAPIADAEVELFDGDPAVRGVTTKVLATGRTDGDGRFEPGWLAVGSYDLRASAEGRAPLTVRGIEVSRRPLEAGPFDLGTLALAPGFELEGRAVDPEGSPVSDAEIRYAESSMLSGGSFRGPTRTTRTDLEGRFVLRNLGEPVALMARKEGYLEQVLAQVDIVEQEPVEVRLEPAVMVRGRVLDSAGEPVPGTVVQLSQEDAGGLRVGGTSSEATSDAEGRFILEGVRPGRCRISAWAEGFRRWWRNGVEVPGVGPSGDGGPAGGGLEDLEIVLEEGYELSGTVVDAAGRPAAGASVIAHRPSSPRPMASSPTDAEGRYRLKGLGPGPYGVIASRDNRRVFGRVTIGEGGEIVLARGNIDGTAPGRLDLRLPAGYSISGRVVDRMGRGVEGARVQAAPLGGLVIYGGAEATSLSGGHFRLEDLQNGPYEIAVTSTGYRPLQLERLLEIKNSDIEGLELALRRGTTLHGRVLGLEAQEIGQVSVFDGTGNYWTKPDFEGRFVFEDLAPGTYLVTAQVDSSGRYAQEEIVIEEGMERLDLELLFGGGLRLAVRVTHLGQPLVGTLVMLWGIDGPTSIFAATNHHGTAVFDGLPGGAYRLQIKDLETGLGHEGTFELVGEEHLEIELVTARVAGRIVTPDGQGVAEVPVRLERLDGFASPLMTGSDSQGVFAFGAVPPGRWRIKALRPGASVMREIEVYEGGIENLELVLGSATP